MEKKKYSIDTEGSAIKFGLDTNADGENVLELKLYIPEAVAEVLKKGDKITGVKVVDFEFGLDGLKLKLDTDQDGEAVLELNVDVKEAIDEAGFLS